MIEINLLPPALREAKKANKNNLPINLVLLSINGVLLAVLLIVTALNLYHSITLRALTTQLKGLGSKQQEITTLRNTIENYRSSNEFFAQRFTPPFLWAQILNNLSNSLVPGVWLRHVSMRTHITKTIVNYVETEVETKFLVVDATVVSIKHDEMGLISSYVRELKANEDFFDHFSKLELESVLRRQIALVEVMDFSLMCYLKNPEVE
ncbi:MAG: hypothetical protein GY853_04970 [PVC group bacterium]|nr:hypothetical protein [PVC group bacterium]